MKNTRILPAFYCLISFLFIALCVNCKSKVKPGPEGIKVPDLNKKYGKLHTEYKKFKKKKPENTTTEQNVAYDIFKDYDDSTTGHCKQAAYDEKSEKIYLSETEDGESIKITKNLILSKNKTSVLPGEAWIDIDEKGSHTQADMTEADIKEFLAKF